LLWYSSRALETKGLQRLLPKNGSWGFFGWHLVKPKHKEIIITEGEYDAMAVAQALQKLPSEHRLHDIPVVSLPNGCSSLPVELLPRLERFQTIFLWLDNDKPGMDGAEKMARKLGLKRCLIVRPDPSMQVLFFSIQKIFIRIDNVSIFICLLSIYTYVAYIIFFD